MDMTTKLSMNGSARKTLADQIDRLDGMLDGLSEGLNDAVAAAVKDAVGAAVQQAVQAVLREVLTNPQMLARFQATAPAVAAPASAPATPPQALKVGWKQRWASVRQALTAWVAAARMECGRRVGQARRLAAGAWNRICILGRFPYSLLAAVVVGVTTGVAASFTRPWWSVAVNGVGWLAATAALQVQSTWRRLTTPTVEATA
jgi:AcrR family transcriptional regulator